MSIDPTDSDVNTGEPGYTIVPSARLAMQTWLFRGVVVLLAYSVAALGGWLVKDSPRPLIDALGPACGVVLGFGILRWMELSREKVRE